VLFRFKDGHEIYEDARIKISRDTQRIENYYLTLNLARTEDAGTYEMKATNFIGETTSTCKVAVLSKSISYKTWFSIKVKLKTDYQQRDCNLLKNGNTFLPPTLQNYH